MSKISKVRGTGYEYRIRDFFINEKQKENYPSGWKAERNSLSREETSFGVTTAKHDVKAWKDLDKGRIFLQIEAKKTAKDIHTIQKKWIDKIDWDNDELLVIALNRTDHYAVLDLNIAYKLHATNESINLMGVESGFDLKLKEHYRDMVLKQCLIKLKCRGQKSVRVHKADIEKATVENPILLNWTNINRSFYIIPLISYVRLREQGIPNINTEHLDEEQVENNSVSDIDIPVIEIDNIPNTGLIVECPYTNKPIKLLKKQ